jgi:hypothetical protein
MNVERGFRRLTAVASALILLAGLGAVAFDWFSSMSSWRDATAKPPEPPVSYVVGGNFISLPEGFSEKQVAAALTELEETFQLSRADDGESEPTATSSKPPVSYLYLPGALPGREEPPPGYVLDKSPTPPPPPPGYSASDIVPVELPSPPSSGQPAVSTLRIASEAKPDVVRAIRQKYPGAYKNYSDSDLAKAVAQRYPQLGRGHLWTRKTLLEDEARGVLPPPVVEAVAKLRQKDLLPYGNKPDPRIHLTLIAATIGAAAVPWILFFVIRWIARGFGGRGEH